MFSPSPLSRSHSTKSFTAAPWKKFGRQLVLQGVIAAAGLGAASQASAATWVWDADPAAAGLQDGNSVTNWSTGSAMQNWWNGTQNVLWQDSTPAVPIIAQFGSGGTPGTKTVSVTGTVKVAGLLFGAVGTSSGSATAGYTLSGGNIAIADNGTIELGDGATTSGTFATISSALSGENIVIKRTATASTSEQFLALTGSNTWTGKLTIEAAGTGGLFLRTTAAALNSLTTIEVGSGNTLSLQGANAVFNSNFILSGVGSGASPQRGVLRFDNNMTLNGTITMAADSVVNFQSSTPTASDVIFNGGIGETGGSRNFTKTGLGTLTLRGASTYTGSTIIAASGSGLQPGTMLLDFANSTTTTDLLYHDVTKEVLILAGNGARNAAQSNATLAMVGKDGTVNSQSFAGLAVSGPTTISVTSGVGGTANMDLGAILRFSPTNASLIGTTLSIIGPASGNITTSTNIGTLLGMWATYTDKNGVTTWAGSSSVTGVIGAYTGETVYTTGSNLAAYGGETQLTLSSTSTGATTQTGDATIGSVTMSDTASRVIGLGGNRLNIDGIQLLSTAGNLTVGTGSAAEAGTISTSGNESELFLSNFSSSSLLIINSVITGGSNITLNGTGATVLVGANNYTGITTIAAGILEVRSNTALGSTSGRTVVGAGATLRLAGGLTIAEPVTLSGSGVSGAGALVSTGADNTISGATSLSGDSALIVTDSGNTLTLTGALGGTAGLVKAGNGTLVLSGANTFTGATSITAGVVRVTTANALGSTAANTVVSAGAALEVSSATSLTLNAEPLALNGTGVAGGGALRNIAGDNTLRGTISLQSATRINSDAGTLTLDVASGNAIAGTQNLTFGGAGNIVVADTIAIATGTVTKDGTGTLTFSGANSYTGATTILGGTLALGASDVFTNSAAVNIDGGAFSVGAFSDILGAVTLRSGAITGTTGVLTGSAYIMQSGTVSAILGGTAALTKTTSGTVTLSGANTYSGLTSVNVGRLVLDYSGGVTVLGATNAVTLGGGTLEIRGGVSSTAISLGDVTMGLNSGMTTLVLGTNAAMTAKSLTRSSGSAILIDLSAAGSSLVLATAPATAANGQILGTLGSNAAVVMKDAAGKYDFAALGAGNTVVRLNASTPLGTSGGSTATAYVLPANDSSRTLSGTVNASTLRIDATNGGTLDLAGNSLNLNLFGLLVDGSGDYTITNSGSAGTLNQAASSAVFLYQFGTGKLTLNATIGAPQAFLMGTGLIDWTSNVGVTSANFIYGATVRATGAALATNATAAGNGTAALVIGNGGILELAAGDFTRSLGTGTNNVRFLADGGFSAYGANRAVNIGGSATPSTITWGASNFLASGSKLILGSKYANAVVDFKNGLDLAGATQTIEVQSVNQAGIGGKVSGNIVGSGNLAKTGQGILTLAGANTYTGSTLVSEGTLAVTGSILNTSSVGVSTGAELQLSGAGSIAAATLALDNASKLSLEVGTLAANTISLTGTATLTGSITLALTLISDPTDGRLFTFIDSAMLAGYSAGARFLYNGVALNEGDFFTVSNGGFSQIFQISYHGGNDGGNVTVLAVPEPSTAFTLLASTSLLLGLNRFRRRRH